MTTFMEDFMEKWIFYIFWQKQSWNADAASPTHSFLLPACLASLIHYFNTPVIQKSFYLLVISRPVKF